MKRGFTLIEVLILLAIVGILGAVVYGSLHPEKAKAACKQSCLDSGASTWVYSPSEGCSCGGSTR